MVAIVIVGMVGIAVSFGLKSRLSGPPEIASIKADKGPDKQPTAATSNADVPAKDAAILGSRQNHHRWLSSIGAGRTFGLPQAEKKTPPSESHAQLDNGPTAVPAAPALAPTRESRPARRLPSVGTVKTELVPPDGALLPQRHAPASK